METVFLDGRFVQPADARISAFDAGIQHGVGIFDTMLGGIGGGGAPWALHLEQHLERLVGSARDLGLSNSVHTAGLRDAVLETIRRSKLEWARVRVTLTGGDLNLLGRSRGVTGGGAGPRQQPTILISAQPATDYPAEMLERGVGVTIADTRANPLNQMEGHKALNYWWRLRELAAAARKGAAEAIVLQVSNHLCGGCVSNVFVMKGGELWTPIARGEEEHTQDPGPGQIPAGPGGKGVALPSPVLPGVVRSWVLAEAARREIPVRRRMIAIAGLLDADEVFLTNSSWGVLPAVKVEREAIGDGVVGRISADLVAAWRGLVRAEMEQSQLP